MKNISKRLIIVLILIVPMIILMIGSNYFFDIFEYIKKIVTLKNKLIVTKEDVPLIKDTFGYIINIYYILITGIFSYYIYQSGEKSRELAKEIKEKEDKKDKQDEVEKVFKVFYTLVYNIEKIIHNDKEKKEDISNEILLEDNFIKELSVLSTILNKDEIIKIYNIYKNIIVIKSNEKSDKRYKVSYETIIKEIIMEEILNMNVLQSVQLEYALNEEYYDIFNRIYKKQFLDDKVESYGNREIIQDENIMHRGIYKDGSFLYEISYRNNNKIEEKILYAGGKAYRDGKYINSKFEGYSKEFLEGKLVYEGFYRNGFYNGKGKKIDSSKTYEGDFQDGQIISGEYNDFELTFKGEFKNGKPYKGLGTRLVKDEYNHVDYWEESAWQKNMEEREEEEYYENDDYSDDYHCNPDKYELVERVYAKANFENGKEILDLKNLETKDEYVEKH